MVVFALGLAALLLGAPPASAALPAGFSDQPVVAEGPSGRFLIGGDWLFRYDRGDRGIAEGWARHESTDGWTRIAAPPHAWNATDYSRTSEAGTVGWYRRDFELPDVPSATQWLLRFEGVNMHATVYLNGEELGSHAAMQTRFELSARTARPGLNRLVVRIDNRVLPHGLRGGVRYLWNYGGMLREVYLRPVNTIDIPEVHVVPSVACSTCAAEVTANVHVVNYSGTPQRAAVRGRLGEMPLDFGTVDLPPGGDSVLSTHTTVAAPRLWSPTSPNLYPASATASVDGVDVASYSLVTGFRHPERRRGHLYLNGKHMHLHGVSLQEHWPGTGAAITPEQRQADFGFLTALRVNVIRSQYPLHPAALETADRLGIAVWEGIPVQGLGGRDLRSSTVRRQAREYITDMITRDMNHPSVIVWSVGNENELRYPIPDRHLDRYIHDMTTLVRQRDPTRLVAVDIALLGRRFFRGYTHVDALGINTYPGSLYKRFGEHADRTALKRIILRLHRRYKNQALVITEFGAETVRRPGGRGGQGEQLHVLRWMLPLLAKSPHLNGTLIWLLRDFPVRTDWLGTGQPFNTKGLLTWNNRPKRAFAFVAKYYQRLTGKP